MSAPVLRREQQYLWILGKSSSDPCLVLSSCVGERSHEDATSEGRMADINGILLDATHELVLLILSAKLKQVLHDVVAEHVARKRARGLDQSLSDLADLSWRTCLQQALDDSAPVAVFRCLHHQAVPVCECVDNELEGLRLLHRVDDLLQHVVPMRTTHGPKH
eukprot:CAMPEP_0115550202 /NCGR_PEP_ID=MMETSP0271-20121206/95099_1 /TAXON_ID=71861 /ORGANISM="Scrippsiella trochoidea, Strain CCMP3099" /LENGTH=162 /DNA_ID=CAMNT_0002983775 /DNA_START=174 /DNA_END=659 /DNA_ORIENTATION=+